MERQNDMIKHSYDEMRAFGVPQSQGVDAAVQKAIYLRNKADDLQQRAEDMSGASDARDISRAERFTRRSEALMRFTDQILELCPDAASDEL